ncbi:bacteriohopanetetrol glucosamine biosynthesis glycosyltransferase HpnI [Geobacter argillaceus]|nr:bacteriohopanetetrol glucosamine biosynthesis glycosyltransferase HpnI [Geobacter argillaceus]
MLRSMLPFIVILPSLAYGLISLFCARSFFGGRPLAADHTPPVTVIKPVKGMDAESFENFASFCRQEYPEFQLLFAVAAADDPAVAVIRRLIEAFSMVDIELVINPAIHGPNYKVCNLMNAWPRAKHGIVIVCDSDIRVGPEYLARVCAPFADPAVGLVTSLYRSSRVDGLATVFEALGFTAEMIPNVMVALRLEGLSFALGASMACRREALDAIGGFPSLVNYLADDYQLGNKIHLAGYRLELSGYFVESVMKRESLTGILSRQLRWCRTMRASRTGGYFASGITQPFAGLLAALLIAGFSPAGWWALLLLYAVRGLVVTIFSRWYVRDRLLPRYLWLLPLRDLLAFATWALAFLGNRVRWRGHLFRLLPGGAIEEIG